jgi:indole-3-glycerol phosphate synthase
MDILTEILAQKRKRVEAAKVELPLAEVIERAAAQRASATPHRLRRALSSDSINIIAEFKRRSPSKGVINAELTLDQMARNYEAGRAAAMSVLTEADFFDGSIEDLKTVKQIVKLPVLRKDFIFDEYQVHESAMIGADAVLLIVAALDNATLLSLRELIEDKLGMDALVEVHDGDEMTRAIAAGAGLIGVNNRNLRTFNVSLDTSLKLAQAATPDMILVSESGISTKTDIQLLRQAGYQGFLIGESLMRSENPVAALSELMS